MSFSVTVNIKLPNLGNMLLKHKCYQMTFLVQYSRTLMHVDNQIPISWDHNEPLILISTKIAVFSSVKGSSCWVYGLLENITLKK